MKLGLALLRLTVGGLFVGHGLQKLFGWFGGEGLRETGEKFESMGLRPGPAHATAAGAGETAGGALIAAGLLTPVGSALVSGSMLTAIRKVHGPKGPWVTEGGYEYNLVLLATAFALTDVGPGPLSLDRALGIERSGARWALAELAAAAAGSAVAVAIAERRQSEPRPEPAVSDGDGAAREEAAARIVARQAVGA